jgi:hypothetical protein
VGGVSVSGKFYIPLHKNNSIMAATKKTTTKKTGNNKPATKEKLSKVAQWMMANPDRSKDVIIYDKSILYN